MEKVDTIQDDSTPEELLERKERGEKIIKKDDIVFTYEISEAVKKATFAIRPPAS